VIKDDSDVILPVLRGGLSFLWLVNTATTFFTYFVNNILKKIPFAYVCTVALKKLQKAQLLLR